jgi:hypothetical protein
MLTGTISLAKSPIIYNYFRIIEVNWEVKHNTPPHSKKN